MPKFVAEILASPTAHTIAMLAIAFMLGTAIGLERQWRQRTAGLRTNVLVALGAAAFSELGTHLSASGGAQIVGYIVSGIGFLGAGVILKDGTNIRGLNTAATLWCSAAVGAFTGSGFWLEAAALTFFVLAGNTVLRPIVNWIDRRPIVSGITEAAYQIHAICAPDAVSDVRDLIDLALARVSYPVRDVETLKGEGSIELIAKLIPTTAKAEVLETVIGELESSPLVKSATWTVETAA